MENDAPDGNPTKQDFHSGLQNPSGFAHFPPAPPPAYQRAGFHLKEAGSLSEEWGAPQGPGVTGSTVFWPDKGQTYWFTSDDPNGQIHVIRRSDGAVVGNFGRVGRGPGEFENLHNIAIDSKGNIYTAEVQGQRIQRFLYKGGLPPIN